MGRQYGMAATWHSSGNGHAAVYRAAWWRLGNTPPAWHRDDLGVLLLLHDIVGRVDNMDDRTLTAKMTFGLNEDDVSCTWATGPFRPPAAGRSGHQGLLVGTTQRKARP